MNQPPHGDHQRKLFAIIGINLGAWLLFMVINKVVESYAIRSGLLLVNLAVLIVSLVILNRTFRNGYW